MVDHEFLRAQESFSSWAGAGNRRGDMQSLCYRIRCGSLRLLAVANVNRDKEHRNCAGLKKHNDGEVVSVQGTRAVQGHRAFPPSAGALPLDSC